MQSEYLMLRQMFSGDHLPVAVLLGLFTALLFRRDSIASVALFRLGYIFFILSLVVPAIVQSYFLSMGSGGLRAVPSGEGMSLAVINALGPVLQGVGLMFTLGSLMPRRVKRPLSNPPAPPQKHPLDA